MRALHRFVDDHPDAKADLRVLFGFDVGAVWRGTEDVTMVWPLIERLTIEPRSVFRAKLLAGDDDPDGWREWIGFDTTAEYLAVLIDAVQVNSAITAAQGVRKKPRAVDPIHRPGLASSPADGDVLDRREEFRPKHASTLAELNLGGIAAMMNQ